MTLLCNNKLMECPKCQFPDFAPAAVCPRCGFRGNPAAIEELSRVEWLLTEMEKWPGLGFIRGVPRLLRGHYLSRRQGAQTVLDLRAPLLTPSEERNAWPDLLRHELLFQAIEEWRTAGYLKTGFLPHSYSLMMELRAGLEGRRRPDAPPGDRERLETLDFFLGAIQQLVQRGDFTSLDAERKVTAPLLAEIAELKTRLTALPPPASPAPAPARVIPEPEPAPVEQPPAPPSPVPRQPIMERLWRSILSERTLHALLFLGIFLLFAAAVSFVIWGWKDFSAPVRIAIPSSFTVLFFALGWYVRTKTLLSRSGIALSAIAALFIPIDCYTIYANYGSPPDGWPEF